MTGYIEVKLVSDDDGHEYLIPAELDAKFNEYLSNINARDQYEDDWYLANEVFDDEFSKYRIGGVLDVLLYAKADYVDDL